MPQTSLANDPAQGYFLYHSIGQYPEKQADLTAAMAEFAQVWAAPNGAQWGYVLEKRAAFVDCWRRILNCPEGTATTCESVTDGMHMLIRSLPEAMLKGKRVLVTADCFPSLHFLLAGLAPKMGFTLETVLLSEGKSWVETEDMIARWGRDVALGLVTWVTSTASARCDVAALTAHGHDMGSLVCADVTQAAGLLPFDASALDVDFVLSTSLKWMCGTPGAGIFYAKQSLINDLAPESRGWFSQENPFSWDLDKFAFAPDARRFDGGTPASVAAIASLPALQWHSRQDHANLVSENRQMVDRIITLADGLNLPLNSPREPEKRGGSVMLRMSSAAEATAIVETLGKEGFSVDSRDPILRLSPGNVSSAWAIDAAFETIGRVLGR